MRIIESLWRENDRRRYQELCSESEAYGLKKHMLTRSDFIVMQSLVILEPPGLEDIILLLSKVSNIIC